MVTVVELFNIILAHLFIYLFIYLYLNLMKLPVAQNLQHQIMSEE